MFPWPRLAAVFVTYGICRVARSRNGLREKGFWDIFFENLIRFLQDIGPNASIKKMKMGCMAYTVTRTIITQSLHLVTYLKEVTLVNYLVIYFFTQMYLMLYLVINGYLLSYCIPHMLDYKKHVVRIRICYVHLQFRVHCTGLLLLNLWYCIISTASV